MKKYMHVCRSRISLHAPTVFSENYLLLPVTHTYMVVSRASAHSQVSAQVHVGDSMMYFPLGVAWEELLAINVCILRTCIKTQ